MTRVSILIAAAVFYVAFIARTLITIHGTLYSMLSDDAMVSMRYARNLASGYGLVWNPGGVRVQGFTNPLWTLVMAAVHAAGVPQRLAPLAVMALGACVLLATSAAVYRVARDITESDSIAVAAAAFTAFGYALVYWTLRGMEVGLLAGLLIVSVGAAISYGRRQRPRDLVILVLAGVAAIWTRLDAAVPLVVVLTCAIWMTPGRRPRVAVAAVVTLVAGLAPPMLFGHLYYSAALPNSYVLKIDGIPLMQRWARGARTMAAFLIRGQGIALVPAVALFAGRCAPDDRARRELLLIGAVAASVCVYSVYVGGDVWEWMGYANRFVAIAMPEIAILTAAAARTFIEDSRSIRAGVPIICALLGVQAVMLERLLSTHRVDWAAFTAFDAHRAGGILALTAMGGLLALAVILASWRRSFAGLCVALWLIACGSPLVRWSVENAFLVHEDQQRLRLGLLLGDTLAPGGSFAVSWAGNAPYFADRTAVDLLGKTDAVVARATPAGPFVPGHDKRDLPYSIGRLRPDVACDLPTGLPGPPDEAAYLAEQGYGPIGGSCYARPSPRVDDGRLRAGLRALDW